MSALNCCWTDRNRVIIKSLGAFTNESAANEPFQSAQCGMILGRRKAEGIANRVCASGSPDAMHVIFRMFRKVVIDDM